jgi:hypothetical protein
MTAPELVIDHDSTSAFAKFAAETWLRFTDDSPAPDHADPEVFFRLGLLIGLQLVGFDLDGDPEVLAALPVTGGAMRAALQMAES